MPDKETLNNLAYQWLDCKFLERFLEIGKEYQKKLEAYKQGGNK